MVASGSFWMMVMMVTDGKYWLTPGPIMVTG